MKLYHKLILALVIFAATVFFLISCSVIPPIEVPLTLAPTRGTISVVDAATGAQLEGVKASVKIRAYGQGNNIVTVLLSYPPTDGNFRVFETETGLVSFGLDETEASAANPVDFLVKVEAPGYISTSKPFTLDQTLNPAVTVSLVKTDPEATPEGVSTVTNDDVQVDASGTTQQEVVIDTPTENQGDPSLEVEIPAGTTLLDNSGQPVRGTITTEVTLFNNQAEGSVDAFPGGLSNVEVRQQGNTMADGSFVTAGFVAMDMRNEQGQEVTNFSEPITMTVEIDPNTINPETGQAIKHGDIIPVWSYNENTGEWKYETQGTVEGPDADGNYVISYQASHLSYWNLDWFWTQYCSRSRRINIQGNANNLWLDYKLYFTSGDLLTYWQTVNDYSQDNFLEFFYAPVGIPMRMKAFATLADGSQKEVGHVDIDNLCGTGALNLNLDLSSIPQVVNLNVDVTVTINCSGLTGKVRPDLQIWYKPKGTRRWLDAGWMQDGKLTIYGVYTNTDYDIKVDVEGVTYTGEYRTGSSTNVVINEALPSDYCP